MNTLAATSVESPSPFPWRWLLLAGIGSLLMRLWVAAVMPVTGDEAFFYWWGVFPAWGYSDHPPMVGWLIWLMRQTLGDSLFSIRVPVVLLPAALGGLLWWGFSAVDRVRTGWAVALFWLAPVNWLNTMITTDTPLIFWSALAVASLARAERREKLDGTAWALYALSGAAMGGAVMSKYFSALLGLAMILYFVIHRRERLHALALMLLCASPGPALNIAFNMSHCWTNVMFNVYNRNSGEHTELRKPLAYIGLMVYLLTPAAVWYAVKARRDVLATLRGRPLLAMLVVVPLACFAVLSLKKIIGLHWVLSFYPLLFVLLGWSLPAAWLQRCAKGVAVFTGLHVVVALAMGVAGMSAWQHTKLYPSVVRSIKGAEIVAQVQAPGVVVMANAYTPASIFGWARRAYMPVFGPGRFHARQDDLLVDYSIYEGQTIRVLAPDAPNLAADYAPYFNAVRTYTITQDGAAFHVIEGTGFRFEAYRRGVLQEVNRLYYNIPTWLPMTHCGYCQRLCGADRCSRE